MRKRALFFIILSVLLWMPAPAECATLAEIYGTMIQEGDLLFSEEVSFFGLNEESQHGLADYDEVYARAGFTRFDTSARFSLGKDAEMVIGLTQACPAGYTREVYNPSGRFSVEQDYNIDNLWDYFLYLRARKGAFEPYIRVMEKTQKTDWHSSNYPGAPDYYAYIRSHYEDISAGLRYLWGAQEGAAAVSALSILDRPLLDAGQVSLDALLQYRNGTVRRNSYYYFNSLLSTDYNMYHRLDDQVTPAAHIGLGIGDTMEFASGLSFSFPYKYFYEYRRRSSAGRLTLKSSYKTDRDFAVPLRLRYRPADTIELTLSADTAYCRQRLDYWRVETTGSVTRFDSKKLNYLNTKPSLSLLYLLERGKEIRQDALSGLTGAYLSAGQLLTKFSYVRDIAHLDKSDGNGPQNRIDPYNVFMYPLDYFVTGTEYANFFLGNYSGAAADTAVQNYNLFTLDLLYGVTDWLNVGAVAGYRSKSNFHTFAVGGSSVYELRSRAYALDPYWFLGIPCHLRVGKNVSMTLSWFWVPQYPSSVAIDGLPKEFSAETEYQQGSLSVQILF